MDGGGWGGEMHEACMYPPVITCHVYRFNVNNWPAFLRLQVFPRTFPTPCVMHGRTGVRFVCGDDTRASAMSNQRVATPLAALLYLIAPRPIVALSPLRNGDKG